MRLLSCWCLALALAAVPVQAGGRDAPLVEAIKKGDVEAVQALLQKRTDVNAVEQDGTTPLHWAAEADDPTIVQLLIRAGANVKAANRYGATPLMAACIAGNAAIVGALLRAGVDPNTASPDGETALMLAARSGNVEAVKALLARGADVNAREGLLQQTALMWAAAENHAETVKTLIEAGADVEARTDGGFTPFLFAVRAGQIDAVEALLAAGADVNTTLAAPPVSPSTGTAPAGQSEPPAGGPPRGSLRGAGTSALVMAVVNAHFELAALLLKHGADPNADAQGWTALHQLAWTRRPPNVKGLPPPVPTGNLDGLGLAKVLIAHGANPNARQKREPSDGHRSFMLSRIGATPLFGAAKGADIELMRLLVENGADPLVTTEEGATVLMAAAGVGIWKTGESAGTNEEALEAVKVALEFGIDVNTADARGNTALHGAAIRGAAAIARLLIDKGARIDVRNKIGWTPLTVAEGVLYPNTFSRSLETAAVLRQLGAKDPGVRRPEDFPPSEVFAEAAKVSAQKPK